MYNNIYNVLYATSLTFWKGLSSKAEFNSTKLNAESFDNFERNSILPFIKNQFVEKKRKNLICKFKIASNGYFVAT